MSYGACSGARIAASAGDGCSEARGRAIAIDRTNYTALIAGCTSSGVVVATRAVNEIKRVERAEGPGRANQGGTRGAVVGYRARDASELANPLIVYVRKEYCVP